jgi:hypothetical protein
MGAYPLGGQVGGGWALEIESFLGPVKWQRADRRKVYSIILQQMYLFTHRSMKIAALKIRPLPWKKSRSIPSQMRGSHGKKEHGQTLSVRIKISGGLGVTRETREK